MNTGFFILACIGLLLLVSSGDVVGGASSRHTALGSFVTIAEYVRAFRDPAVIHASCEDYRAAASIDLEHDAADATAKVTCPLLVLWGSKGRIAQMFDVSATWREQATDVRGRALPCGHYLPEEAPEQTLQELLA